MICPKCESSIPDGSRFCSSCGAEIQPQNSADRSVTETVSQNSDAENEKVSVNQKTDTGADSIAPERQTYGGKPGAEKPKKPLNTKIIAAAAAVVVVVAAAFAFKAVFSSKNGGNALVYISDGEYELLTDFKKAEPIEFDSPGADDDNYDSDDYGLRKFLVSFSEDGKYMYYYTHYDRGTGTLCRAEYKKLGKNQSKNSKYITEIASDVRLGFTETDGGIVYEDIDSDLYFYNGKKSERIAKNISYYRILDGGKTVYATRSDDGIRRLYGTELKNPDDNFKIASGDIVIQDFSREKGIVIYSEKDDDDVMTLYRFKFGSANEPEKIGDNVRDIEFRGDYMYFSADDGNTLNLYDYVEDDCEEQDSKIKEPDIEDYSVPYYSHYRIYDNDVSESEYDELYTTVTAPVGLLGQSMEHYIELYDSGMYDYDDGMLIYAVKDFAEKYKDKEDEYGCIKVTDEVKADLEKIADSIETDGDKCNWLRLCVVRYQSGSEPDRKAYNEAYDEWRDANDRIEARKELKSDEGIYKLRGIYLCKDGEITELKNELFYIDFFDNAVVFTTKDYADGKIKMSDVRSIHSVKDMFEPDRERDNRAINLLTSKEFELPKETLEKLGEIYSKGYAEIHFGKQSVYINGEDHDEDGELWVAEIKNSTVGEFKKIDDGASFGEEKDGIAYYVKNRHDDEELTYLEYCDLYAYDGKESKCLAKDVIDTYGINVFDDETVLAYTAKGELSMFDKNGENTVIADDVTQFRRTDKNIVYISDGDLYRYDGKRKTRIKSDVSVFFCKEAEEPFEFRVIRLGA